MITKITEALTTEYANTGVGEKAFNGVANLLSKTVNEETDISAYVKEDYVKGLITAIQGSVDSERNKRAEMERQLNELKSKSNQTPPPSDPPKPTDPPKDDNEVLKYLKEMRAEMESLKTQTEAQRKEKAKNDLLTSTTAFFANAKHLNKANLDTAMEFCYMTVNESSTEDELRSAIIAKYDELQSRHGGLDKYVAIPASGGGKERPEKKWAAEAEKRKAQANK